MKQRVKTDALAKIGQTPLIRLKKIEDLIGKNIKLFAKADFFNPTGSAKDRAALFMIEEAEKEGLLKEGGTIVEPSSGNTGISLAFIGVQKGYQVIITMPDTMSTERRQMISAYGANIVLTEGAKGMTGALTRAKELVRDLSEAYLPDQFNNMANLSAHYATTGPEIIRDCPGPVSGFVAGIGSGGTISGVGKLLKESDPATKIIGLEPANSPILNGGQAGPHKIQGIGAGFIPGILDRKLIDIVLTVEDNEAFKYARILAEKEGLMAGISSGAALSATINFLAGDYEPKKKGENWIVFLPDRGERYLSMGLYE